MGVPDSPYLCLVAGTALVAAIPLSFMLTKKFFKCRSRRGSSRVSILVDDKGHKCVMIAHKGAALDGPENTLGAIHKAAANGFDGVEIDVQLTKDGVAVLIHDTTLDRTTNGSGNVSDFTFAQIEELNAAAKFEGAWEGMEIVPTMVEAVEAALDHNLFVFFDMKDTGTAALDQLISLYQKRPELYKRSVVSAFDFSFLYRVKRRDRAVPVVPIYEGFTLSEVREGNHTLLMYPFYWVGAVVHQTYLYLWFYYVNPRFLQFDLISVSQTLITKEFLKWAERWDKDVVVWTVNDHETKFDFLHHKRLSVMTDSISQL